MLSLYIRSQVPHCSLTNVELGTFSTRLHGLRYPTDDHSAGHYGSLEFYVPNASQSDLLTQTHRTLCRRAQSQIFTFDGCGMATSRSVVDVLASFPALHRALRMQFLLQRDR